MADGDYYSKRLPPKWAKVKNLIAGGFDAENVAGFASLAMGEAMRRTDGVPGFARIESAFIAAATGDRQVWGEAGEQVLRDVKHHVNTEKFVEAGTALLETQGPSMRSLDSTELAQELTEAGLERIVRHHLGRCYLDGMADRFETRADLSTFEQQVVENMPLHQLATQLIRHPDGQGFRTPRRAKPAAGTAALLNKPLGSS